MVSVGIFNTIALVVFTVAFCWRLDQIRKHGGGFQAIALTVSIAALVIAFVSANGDVVDAIDTLTFTGAARVVFYAMLSLGVAALILVRPTLRRSPCGGPRGRVRLAGHVGQS